MKPLYQTVLAAAFVVGGAAISPMPARGADAPADAGQPAALPQIETLVIGNVKVGNALAKASAAEGRINQLERVTEAMDTQFRAALSASRKFKIVVGNDLSEIMAKQKRGALYDANDPNAPKVGQLRPPKYVVIPTIDDFQDVGEKLQSEGREPLASARRIRISVVATIYDINTGEEKETANIQVSDRKVTLDKTNLALTGDSKDELLLTLTRQAAEKSAQRVVDVVFPAKIVALRDKVVTINRGDGTTVAIGQVWDVFALGPELKDPDTGASLGREEVKSGKVRITSIAPLTSKGEVVEDQGLDKGQILRLHEAKAAGDKDDAK